MAVVQNAYAERQDGFVAGQVPTMENTDIVSRLLEDATIVAGAAVFYGTADNQVTGTAAAGDFEGIVVRDVTVEGDVADTFVQTETLGVLKRGPICVTASVAVAKGDPVTVTAGAFTTAGGVAIPATYDTSAGIGEVAIIRVTEA